MRIGQRIRMRRKQLRLSQADLAQERWSRSYVSQVELGKVIPPLDTLEEIAATLDTTVADLVGDNLHLRTAKATLFYPEVCKYHLAYLPKTPTTIILNQLADALQSNKVPQCQLPPNAELHYLTARVLIYLGKYQEAISVLKQGLRYCDQVWRILFFAKQALVWQLLDNPQELQKTQEQLKITLLGIESLADFLAKMVAYHKSFMDDPLSPDFVDILAGLSWGGEFSQALLATHHEN